MENAIKVFESPEFGQMRIYDRNGDPWFVAADVCKALEIRNSRDAMARLDDDEKGVALTDTPGGIQEMTIINEAGLYSLVLGSRKPEAKVFKRWVTHDILPEIRRNGIYATPEMKEKVFDDPETLIRVFDMWKAEREQRIAVETQNKRLLDQNMALEAENAEMKPKASYYDIVMSTKNTVLITQIAKDYGMSAIKMNMLLRDLKIQYKANGQWVLTAPYADKGYVRSLTYCFDHYGQHFSSMNTMWTQTGRLFIYETLKKRGILPLCEKEAF